MDSEEQSCFLCIRTNCPLRNASEIATSNLSFLEIIENISCLNISCELKNYACKICFKCQEAAIISFDFQQNCIRIINKLAEDPVSDEIYEDNTENISEDQFCEEYLVEEETLTENINLISYEPPVSNERLSSESSYAENDEEQCQIQEDEYIEESSQRVEYAETTENRFLCSLCSNTFKSKDILRRHMVRHTDKSIMCTICPRKFYFERDLKFHLKQHSNPKVYNCEECGKSYGSNTALKAHFLTHSDIRKFVCTFDNCLKRLRTKFSLQNHIKTHTKDKAFVCNAPNCNQKFTQKNILQRHMKAKHKLNLYRCSYCNEKTFEKYREMREHFLLCDAFHRLTQK